MNILIPPQPPSYSSDSLTQAFETLRRALIPAVSKDEAVPRVILLAPNGMAYQLTVDNTGTLQTAVISGKVNAS